ncbi:phosphatidylinositol-specific phospholipase C [Colletotrichum graminicola M1.001]|uniref:Phosphoinositide phospholipase C n=1 Tax=Colletotrichum graminicola (strain M1.001 / M2 / FGSC 10212) TaxID=645133 RepID=E3QYT0_COLGM|nr:phosphatidylinositol-specific phospholipase C [Colletotrichum graminicola M1.001]EFQ36018.1 phosphatidylinositol-specific phospholipase C [Colletotrichum graminicola M1.001]
MAPTRNGDHYRLDRSPPSLETRTIDNAIHPFGGPKDIDTASSSLPTFDVSPAIQGHLKKRTFDEMRSFRFSISQSSSVTREKLGAFLDSVQGETDAWELLPNDKERYTWPEFFEFWWKTYGLEATRPLESDYKDLDQPLPNYFINSSHNTFLIGNQLASKVDQKAYKTVLRRGCRCIEIDVWNGDALSTTSQEDSRPSTPSKARLPFPKDEPIVTLGWISATPCGFREVCKVIGEYAFEVNDLPVIVSLEVHASVEQQNVMVRIMKEEWGEMLLDKAFEGIDPSFRLPTLRDMKRKIMIKVKKASTLHPGEEDSSRPPATYKPDIATALSDLGIYTFSTRFKSFEMPAAKEPGHIFPMVEHRFLALHATKPREIFSHNKHYFMRVFPNVTRLNNSNPDPSQFWRKGVQMVALNWQHLDEGLMINEAMFANEQGWVLKPNGYRSTDGGTETYIDAAPEGDLDLTVTIIAGQHIWVSDRESTYGENGKNLRPFVKCELHVELGSAHSKAATESDFELKTARTSTKTGHPEWDGGARLKFPKVSRVMEELSFIR